MEHLSGEPAGEQPPKDQSVMRYSCRIAGLTYRKARTKPGQIWRGTTPGVIFNLWWDDSERRYSAARQRSGRENIQSKATWYLAEIYSIFLLFEIR